MRACLIELPPSLLLALGQHEDAAVAAFEGLNHDKENEELKQLLRDAVKKGKKSIVGRKIKAIPRCDRLTIIGTSRTAMI
jgi:hypothetical protein